MSIFKALASGDMTDFLAKIVETSAPKIFSNMEATINFETVEDKELLITVKIHLINKEKKESPKIDLMLFLSDLIEQFNEKSLKNGQLDIEAETIPEEDDIIIFIHFNKKV